MVTSSSKNVILHVGLHKTASTFFQECVWPQLKTYTQLTRPYTQHNHAFNQLQYADDSLYDKELVIKELDKINAQNLLISDASLTGKPVIFSYINRSLIAKRLKEIFPRMVELYHMLDQDHHCLRDVASLRKRDRHDLADQLEKAFCTVACYKPECPY